MPVTINGTTGISTPGLTNSSGDMTITNGNLVLGTSGKGIDFSATSSGSGTMTSELLSDYEEGTWTPVLNNSGAGAYSLQLGSYVKVGKSVTCVGVIVKNSGTVTATVNISGLPFTTNNYYGSAAIDSAGGFTVDSGRIDSNATTFVPKSNGAEITSGTNSWNITFTVSYISA